MEILFFVIDILIKNTFSYLDREKSFNKTSGRKTVKFADGVQPGEGTSPSAGEDLPSPPPPPRAKIPKEKRFKKKKKKKKIKVGSV